MNAPARSSGFFYGWIIVLAAFVALLISNGLVLGGISVFDEALLEEFGWDVGPLKFRDLLTFVVAGFGAAGAGALADKYGVRPLIVVGALFLSAGFWLYTRVDSLTIVYAAHVLFGLSLACAGLVINVMLVGRWFKARRGTAIGLALVGTSLGNVIFPLLNTSLLGSFGWRGAMGWLAFLPLALIPLALFLVKEWPRDKGTHPDGIAPSAPHAAPDSAAADSAAAARDAAATPSGPGGMSYGEAIRSRNFWALSTVAFATFYAILAIASHLFLHFRGQGLDPATAASGLSTLFGLGLVGKFVFGFLADRLPHKAVFLGNLVVMLVGAVMLAIVDPATMWYAVVLVGLGWGGLYTLLQLLCVESFGLKAVGAVLGTISIVDAIGGGLGIWLTGVMFDQTGSYDLGFGVIAGLVGVALLAAFAVDTRRDVELNEALPLAETAAPTP